MAGGGVVTTLAASIDASVSDSVLYRALFAGLPNRYRLVEGKADVVVASATDPAAAERAVADGVRAIVLDQPGRLSIDQLFALEAAADQHDCILVPALRYSPRLASGPDLLGGAEVDLLESSITSPDPSRSSLVEQLALVRQVLASVATLRVLHSSASHYVVEATVAGHLRSRVVLNGFRSTNGDEDVSLHAIGIDRHVVVRIDACPLARPADISVFDGDGRWSPWPVHQHAQRITLAGLHRLLTTGEGSITYTLEHLRGDLLLADALGD
jgi:hypothetical protein